MIRAIVAAHCCRKWQHFLPTNSFLWQSVVSIHSYLLCRNCSCYLCFQTWFWRPHCSVRNWTRKIIFDKKWHYLQWPIVREMSVFLVVIKTRDVGGKLSHMDCYNIQRKLVAWDFLVNHTFILKQLYKTYYDLS